MDFVIWVCTLTVLSSDQLLIGILLFFFFAAIVLDFCIGDKLVNLVYLVAFSIAEIGCVRNTFGYVPDLEGGLAFSIVVWF